MNHKNDPTTQRDSITALLGQIADNATAVFHDEIAFVIQKIREKIRAAHSGILTVATGAVICFGAFMSLCAALFIGLSAYMALVFAALVTGAVLALIGVFIAVIGYRQVKKSILKT